MAPRNDLEKQVCKIWSEVLELPLDNIGIRDNFFRLGGNSILSIKLITKLNRKLNCNIPLTSIFFTSSIESLSNIIRYNLKTIRNYKKYEF